MKYLFSWIVFFVCIVAHAQSTVSSYLGLQLSDALIWYSGISAFGTMASEQEFIIQQGHLATEEALDIDYDGDGVIHRYDKCPNTVAEAVVDVDGCRLQLLDPQSLEIRTTHLSCAVSDDGKIAIKATTNEPDFDVLLDGSLMGYLNQSNGFQLQITQLAAQAYTLCMQPSTGDFQSRCFEIQLNAKAPFEVQANAQLDKGILDLLLSDGNNYELVHNGVSKQIDRSSERIFLKKGMNTIEVKTNMPCKGSFMASYFVSEEVRVYPNPTRGYAEIYVGGSDKVVSLTVRTAAGAIVEQHSLTVTASRLVPINLSSYQPGLYILEINGDQIQVRKKLIRQ